MNMVDSNVTGSIVKIMRGFAETKGHIRPPEETDTGNSTRGCSTTRIPAVSCLLRTRTSGEIYDEKPDIKFDDHFNGDFRFKERLNPRGKEKC